MLEFQILGDAAGERMWIGKDDSSIVCSFIIVENSDP
jgi:hypothetical protein